MTADFDAFALSDNDSKVFKKATPSKKEAYTSEPTTATASEVATQMTSELNDSFAPSIDDFKPT